MEDNSFDKWFSRFMYGTEVIFLVASMPHIAAWFAHFDNPTTFWGNIYAWSVGFGLAFAIDGVSFMLLLAITRMLKRENVNGWLVFGMIVFMLFIALLSWEINIQYDVTFASNVFAKAEQDSIVGISIKTLNPIIGGAFQVLILAYALIGKAVSSGEPKKIKMLTDEEYEAEKLRIRREQELKEMRKGGDQGLFNGYKETIMGRNRSSDELFQEAIIFLRDARELLLSANEERALEALSALLKIRSKDALPLLIRARSIINREEHDLLLDIATSEQKQIMSNLLLEQEEDHDPIVSDSSTEQRDAHESMMIESFDDQGEEQDVIIIDPTSSQEEEMIDSSDILSGMQGRDTVSIETAASVLECQAKRVTTLRNQGKLKHAPKRDDQITVASLRSYMATRKRRATNTDKIISMNRKNQDIEQLA